MLDSPENVIDLLRTDVGIEKRQRLLLAERPIRSLYPIGRLFGIAKHAVRVSEDPGQAVKPIRFLGGESVLLLSPEKVPPREMQDRAQHLARDPILL